MTQPSAFRLSICIGTFNRAAFIGATLESIIAQATDDCEIVVADNASTDNTEQVVSEYARRFDRLRYVRQDSNKGLDRNYNCAVELARGEYCWLFSDDDLMKPGAVLTVLEALRRDLSLVLVNLEWRNIDMSKVVCHSVVGFKSDHLYGPSEMDRLFIEVDQMLLMYIGSYVIKREIWLVRDRERCYGSTFIHVGMVFQQYLPGETLLIAAPLISYRLGNTHSLPSATDIIYVKWLSLVDSLALSERAKRTVRSFQWLLFLRGAGLYSLSEYRHWIRPRLISIHEVVSSVFVALLPGVLVNTLFVLYLSRRPDQRYFLHVMKESPFHKSWSRLLIQPAK